MTARKRSLGQSNVVYMSVILSTGRRGICMMSLPIWLPGVMFLPQGVSVSSPMFLPGSLCQRGLCLGGLCPRGLSWGLLPGGLSLVVSIWGCLCPGMSLQGSLSRRGSVWGFSVWGGGLCLGSLYPGSLSGRAPSPIR